MPSYSSALTYNYCIDTQLSKLHPRLLQTPQRNTPDEIEKPPLEASMQLHCADRHFCLAEKIMSNATHLRQDGRAAIHQPLICERSRYHHKRQAHTSHESSAFVTQHRTEWVSRLLPSCCESSCGPREHAKARITIVWGAVESWGRRSTVF